MPDISKIIAELKSRRVSPKLIVSDLDGTLLDDDGNIPPKFWDICKIMAARGILFSPASGRQYAKIAEMFAPIKAGTVFVAENGTYVVKDDQEISSDSISLDYVHKVIAKVEELNSRGMQLKLNVCGKNSAYLEAGDKEFIEGISVYYPALQIVSSLREVDDTIIKLAIYSPTGITSEMAAELKSISTDYQVVISQQNWIDIMNPVANKGLAVKNIQNKYGISPQETFVFGDYLNDLEMMEAAEYSFATANAHPEIISKAKYVIPTSSEHGVTNFLAEFFSNN